MNGLQVSRALAVAALASIALSPGFSVAQDDPAVSAWQAEKCQLYRQNLERALDFFGTDNLNYDFMAQNENFIASGCTAPPSVCARSSQEIEIANALTIEMMNAGAASTFLPFRCQTDVLQTSPGATVNAVESRLCRSQLNFLVEGKKLTAIETAVFEAQCTCLEMKERNSKQAGCAR